MSTPTIKASIKRKLKGKIIEAVAKAEREYAEKIRQDVIENAPYDTGQYAESIQLSDTVNENGKIKTMIYSDYKVYDSEGKGYVLGQLLEYGTKPHVIEPVNCEYLHFFIGEKEIYTKHVEHPGFAGIPHWSTAYLNNKRHFKRYLMRVIRRAKRG